MALQDQKDQQDILQAVDQDHQDQVLLYTRPLAVAVEQKELLAQLIQVVAVELIVQVQEQLVVAEL